MSAHLPPLFVSSSRDFQSYPENVVRKTTYPVVLKAYKDRLDANEKDLFVTRDADVNVPFRNLLNPGPGH